MRPNLPLICLLLACLPESLWGMSTPPARLKPNNLENQPHRLTIDSSDRGGEASFKITVAARDPKVPLEVTWGYLSVHDGDKLISGARLYETATKSNVVFEFTVASDHLANSRFAFSVATATPRQRKLMPYGGGWIQYEVMLKDFAPETLDTGAPAKLEAAIEIEFPKGGYHFTLAEAAKGIKLGYNIVVKRDYPGVIPLPSGPSFAEPAGPSGLHPREQISGNNHVYCLMDFGLAPPRSEESEFVKTLKKGTYRHVIEWDGLNWTGPSDFGNPKGKPFPAGTYDVTVTIHGKLVVGNGKVPYQIIRKTTLTLK